MFEAHNHIFFWNLKSLFLNLLCLCDQIGGTVVLFDRKMLRNFRRDGRNWKKKKDGKTVKEAHEHLKVSFTFTASFTYLHAAL